MPPPILVRQQNLRQFLLEIEDLFDVSPEINFRF